VVHAVQHGLTSREIARRRGISVDAVKFHVSNAIAKLGLSNRKALRLWFRAPSSSALNSRSAAVNAPLKLGQLARFRDRYKTSSSPWYRDVLGLTHSFGKMAFFDLGGTRLYLTQEAASPSASPSSTCLFQTFNPPTRH
jgi:hypothetical protein